MYSNVVDHYNMDTRPYGAVLVLWDRVKAHKELRHSEAYHSREAK